MLIEQYSCVYKQQMSGSSAVVLCCEDCNPYRLSCSKVCILLLTGTQGLAGLAMPGMLSQQKLLPFFIELQAWPRMNPGHEGCGWGGGAQQFLPLELR
jgi:hypothetical protein